MASHLPNHLRAHRKRTFLSQDEVAFLLGAESGAKVCRYEQFSREPSLRTALAYQVVFGKPVSELLAGMYRNIEAQVMARAKVLAKRPHKGKSEAQAARRAEVFATLGAIATKQPSIHQ